MTVSCERCTNIALRGSAKVLADKNVLNHGAKGRQPASLLPVCEEWFLHSITPPCEWHTSGLGPWKDLLCWTVGILVLPPEQRQPNEGFFARCEGHLSYSTVPPCEPCTYIRKLKRTREGAGRQVTSLCRLNIPSARNGQRRAPSAWVRWSDIIVGILAIPSATTEEETNRVALHAHRAHSIKLFLSTKGWQSRENRIQALSLDRYIGPWDYREAAWWAGKENKAGEKTAKGSVNCCNLIRRATFFHLVCLFHSYFPGLKAQQLSGERCSSAVLYCNNLCLRIWVFACFPASVSLLFWLTITSFDDLPARLAICLYYLNYLGVTSRWKCI